MKLTQGHELAALAAGESWATALAIDGVFGDKTERAVTEFQRAKLIPQTKCVDQVTWGALCFGHPLTVVDALDATDITVFEDDHPHLADGHSNVVVSYGMSGGTKQLIEQLVGTYAAGSQRASKGPYAPAFQMEELSSSGQAVSWRSVSGSGTRVRTRPHRR